MIVEQGRLPDCSRILQLEDTLLLDGEHDAVLAAHSDCASTFPDCFEGIVDLGRERSRQTQVGATKVA